MSDLYREVTRSLEHERRKHDKPDDHVETNINRMSQHEFLQAISDALDTVIAEAIADKTGAL